MFSHSDFTGATNAPKSASASARPKKRAGAALVSLALLAGLSLSSTAQAEPGTGSVLDLDRQSRAALFQNPIEHYGPEMRFTILRNGDEIGNHVVRFTEQADGVQVTASTRIAVKIAFVTVFRFEYDSTSLWRDGQLVSLRSQTNDDGDVRSVTVQKDPGSGMLTVSGSKGVGTADPDVIPTDHWNPAALGSTVVINTITGGLNAVTTQLSPPQQVETGTGPRMARAMSYRGQLESTAWYDDQGRWVRLAFGTKDGSQVIYRCDQCGGGDDLAYRSNGNSPAGMDNTQ
ncbi:MAG: DUF6134 family protein [Rhodospirillaceae bacterium]